MQVPFGISLHPDRAADRAGLVGHDAQADTAARELALAGLEQLAAGLGQAGTAVRHRDCERPLRPPATAKRTVPPGPAAALALSRRLSTACRTGPHATVAPRRHGAATVQCKVWPCRRTSGPTSRRRSSRSASDSAAPEVSGRCVSSIARTTSRMPRSPRSSSARLRSVTPGRFPCRFSVSSAFRRPPSGLLISCATPEASLPRLTSRSWSASRRAATCRSRSASTRVLYWRNSRANSLAPTGISLAGMTSGPPLAAHMLRQHRYRAQHAPDDQISRQREQHRRRRVTGEQVEHRRAPGGQQFADVELGVQLPHGTALVGQRGANLNLRLVAEGK